MKRLTFLALLIGVTAFLPRDAIAADVAYVAGSSQKVCQLTGQTDRQFHRPTSSRTETRFGLAGTDEGSSFEHDGKLYFLFGDSLPTATFQGAPNRKFDPPRHLIADDSVAYTVDENVEKCLKLDFTAQHNGAYQSPMPVDNSGRPAITLRVNEIPFAGLSAQGKMFVAFGTDNPEDDHPNSPGGPLGAPTRTVIAQSSDDGRSFHYLYDLSKGPGAKFISIAMARGLTGEYALFWGAKGGANYRKGPVFFARKRIATLGEPGGLQYFAGYRPNGRPRFSPSEADAVALFPEACIGEVSVAWNRFLHRWIMLYNCIPNTPRNLAGIWMRDAVHPWGPWSPPQTIFNPVRDHALCAFIHRAVTPKQPSCDDLAPNASPGHGGGPYGPYQMPKFTTGDEKKGTSTFYYVLSTWIPYNTVIMRTSVQATGRSGSACDETHRGDSCGECANKDLGPRGNRGVEQGGDDLECQ